MSEDEQHQPRVAAISAKLSPFWPSDPNIWFAQVEAQFATLGITNQRTMFEYVVASLYADIASNKNPQAYFVTSRWEPVAIH